jgi:hypothetical protein
VFGVDRDGTHSFKLDNHPEKKDAIDESRGLEEKNLIPGQQPPPVKSIKSYCLEMR